MLNTFQLATLLKMWLNLVYFQFYVYFHNSMIYRSVDQFNQTINEKSTDGVVRDSNQGPQEKKDRGHRQIH